MSPFFFACDPSQARPCASGSISSHLRFLTFRYATDELAVYFVDTLAQFRSTFRRHRRIVAIDGGIRSAYQDFFIHSDLVV